MIEFGAACKETSLLGAFAHAVHVPHGLLLIEVNLMKLIIIDYYDELK